MNDIRSKTENCRTCLSYFNEENKKCALMNFFAINSDSGRFQLMKNIMTTCSITLFSNEEEKEQSEEVFICMSCMVEIDQMLNFLQKCIHSEAKLKQSSQVKTRDSLVWINDSQEGKENRLEPKIEVKVEFLNENSDNHVINGVESHAAQSNTVDEFSNKNINKVPELGYYEYSKTFPSGVSLSFQKFKYSKFKLNSCALCHENFPTLQLFHKHMAAEHDSVHSPQYFCRQCSENFISQSHLNLHELKIHNIKKYGCSVCKRTFSSVSSLKFHKNLHLGVKPYSCTFCSKSFLSASVLREHKKNIHSEIRSFRCHCGRSFNRKKKLELHVESVHEKKDKLRKYSCPKCDKKFHHPYSLKNHLNTHLGLKPFLCNACGAAFSALSYLTSHLRRIHSGEKRPAVKKYLCHTCGDSFARASHLQRHTLRKHVPDAEKKHECPICQKKFLEKSDVTGHIKLHDDVKPFMCNQCSKCFRTSWRLQAHIKRVHLGLRPFECLTCTVKFKTKSHLEKHIRTHTGEKPFPCPHCSYTCAEKSNLKKHINIHLKVM